MFQIDAAVLILIPSQSKTKILKPGKVIESAGGKMLVAEFEESLAIDAGQDRVLFTVVREKFHQQGVKVEEVRQTEPHAVVRFTAVGDLICAEQRQLFRVSSMSAGITANLGRDKGCPVADVSPEGFAAISGGKYTIGSLIDIELTHETGKIVTKARVQTIKTLPDGRNRYGFLAGEKKSPARKALESLTVELQRQQLRRMRRGAA